MSADIEQDLVCLECWTDLASDPFHLDCTGEHFVSRAEADGAREWINGRHSFMVRTGQVARHDGDGAVL